MMQMLSTTKIFSCCTLQVDFVIDTLDFPTGSKNDSVWKTRETMNVENSVEALCVWLKHFTYPCKYADLVPRFGRPVPQLCMITNMMVDDLSDRYSHLLQEHDQPWLSPENLQMYAITVHNKGAALDNCWRFVDGM